jgi:hypothetical protein
MTVHESQLANLRCFGYTEVEARFLYLVATHSGYFTVPQFLTFARAKSGKRNAQFVEKLFRLGHVKGQRYTRRSVLYHLGSRQIYDAIGKVRLRNRRDHELAHIKIRLLALDFILAHPDDTYFETTEQKRTYFMERFRLNESLFSRSDDHQGITFTDRFPLCIAYPSPDYMPVVTFTYIDPAHRKLDAYISHLRTYRPLFRQLPSFQFVYVSTASGFQNEAAKLFPLLVQGTGLSDLSRYFDVRTKWDSKQYGLVKEADLLFLNEAKKHFSEPIFETLYGLWRRNQLPSDLRADPATPVAGKQKVLFRAIAVPGHEAIFRDSTKRWGDGCASSFLQMVAWVNGQFDRLAKHVPIVHLKKGEGRMQRPFPP